MFRQQADTNPSSITIGAFLHRIKETRTTRLFEEQHESGKFLKTDNYFIYRLEANFDEVLDEAGSRREKTMMDLRPATNWEVSRQSTSRYEEGIGALESHCISQGRT